MQDSAPYHKDETVLSFLEEEEIAVTKWSPQSPDMNPLENIWTIIEDKAPNKNPQNIDDLWVFQKEEWESITTNFCKNLIGSCGRRCNEAIKYKGKFTKYWIFL